MSGRNVNVTCRYGGHGHDADGGQRRSGMLTVLGFFSMFCGCGLQALIGKWA